MAKVQDPRGQRRSANRPRPTRRASSPALVAIAASLGIHLAGVLLLPILLVPGPIGEWRDPVHELELSDPAIPTALVSVPPRPPILIPQLGDPAARSARGAVETVQAPLGAPGARGVGEPAPRPDGQRVGEDLDALRFAPYNHPSKDLQGKTSSPDARGSRPPGLASRGRPASSTVAARDPAPYLVAERGEGSTLARPGSSMSGNARPERERDRLSRIPKDGEVALPKGFRVAASAEADHDRRRASSQRFPDRIDAARPSGQGQDTGRGRGALAGRRGSPEGAEHGAPHWLAGGDRRYLDYFRGIYRKVQPLWVFPKQLEVVYEQGEVIIQFAILADGTIRDLRVHKSSGYRQFDANVIAAIEKAAPFGPIPRGLGRRLEILAPFEFANPMVR